MRTPARHMFLTFPNKYNLQTHRTFFCYVMLCAPRLFYLLTTKGRVIIRNKHKPTHWSVLRKKTHPIHKALDHFDDFYKDVFRANWESIRRGLLSTHKYVAVVNNYGDTEDTVAKLEVTGALNMRTLFQLQKSYIQEKMEQNKRVRYLEKIWRTSKDDVAPQKVPEDERKEEEIKGHSLDESLSKADIDSLRLIDDGSGLTAPTLSQFVPVTRIKGKEDFIPESEHFKYYGKESECHIHIEDEYDIHFPEHLNVYCYEHGNYSTFEHPKKGITGVSNYYLMDGGSILPVLALDLRPGNNILDMCGAPGGKSLLALQTLYPNYLVCNDISHGRVGKIYDVFNEYFYDLNERWIKTNRLQITKHDGQYLSDDNFDRILVDVPCTTDRHSVTENDNNIFKPNRIKERLKLPELQCALLVNALKLIKKGGVVVYSTCSLSPIQNDGVVGMALKQIWEETNRTIVVKNLSPALAQVESVFKLADRKLMKYGHLVLPFVPQNYGPMYFCKLQRIK